MACDVSPVAMFIECICLKNLSHTNMFLPPAPIFFSNLTHLAAHDVAPPPHIIITRPPSLDSDCHLCTTTFLLLRVLDLVNKVFRGPFLTHSFLSA